MCAKSCPAKALTLIKSEKKINDTSRGIWVLAEVFDNEVAPVTYQLIGEATRLAAPQGQQVAVLLIGQRVRWAADKIFASGADKIFLAESPVFKQRIEEHFAEVVVALTKEYQPNILLVGATDWGRGVAARVAATLKTGLTADCTELSVDKESGLLLQKRPAFGGNMFATIETPFVRPQMASVRPNVMNAIEPDDSKTGEVVVCDLSQFKFDGRLKEIVSFAKTTHYKSFNDAEIVIGVGRGVKSDKEMELINELATHLGGIVAGSRAAVEMGLVAPEYQIGQTGHTISPKLYIACGISGQIQHTAAILSSEKIIAINCDAQAPIFEYAHYGLVGDLKTVLPQLINLLDA